MVRYPSLFSFLLLFLPVMQIPARAAPQGIAGEPGAGIPESGSLSLANALAAVALDPSTGVLTSSLPIETPAARGVPQPGLALTYNSAAGIREAGVGWGLNLPTIERRNRDGAPQYHDHHDPLGKNPFSISSHLVREEILALDRFVFDGKPLIPICISNGSSCETCETGKPPSIMPEASPLPAWATDGWMYFRLEDDDSRALLLVARPTHVARAVRGRRNPRARRPSRKAEDLRRPRRRGHRL
jgi:hypothetical protein